MLLPKLYSKTSLGQIAEWTIEVEGDSYRTHEGMVGGKITTTTFTQCLPKNVGKANATTGEEQAMKEAQAKHKKKMEANYVLDPKDVDQFLFFEPMLAKKYEDYVNRMTFPVFTQPKLDGMRLVSRHGMFSRNGKPIVSAPHIFSMLSSLFVDNPDLVLDGELYNHKFKNDFNKIMSLAKKTKPTAEDLKESAEKLEFWCYDTVSALGDKDKFSVRNKKLQVFIKTINSDKFRSVQTDTANTNEEIVKLHDEYVTEGYEGLMIRFDAKYDNKRSASLLKMKSFQDEEYELVDLLSGLGNRTGLASSALFKTASGDSFSAGVIGNDDYSRELLTNKNKYIGKKATVVFQNLTPEGVPRFGKMKIIRDYE